MSSETPGPLRIDVVPLHDPADELLAAWRDLAADAAEPNPFFEPELLLPAVRRLAGGDGVRLLTAWRGERLVLAMPVTRARYGRLPVPALTTWRHPYCYLGTPLVRRDELDAAAEAALTSLRADGGTWLVLEQVYVHGPVAAAFRRAAGSSPGSWIEHGLWERPAVRAREPDDPPAETLTPRSAKTLRRLRRNLEKTTGALETRNLADADEATLDSEIDAFLELELAGWKGRAGTAMGSADEHAAFFRETCRALARSGRLELWRLQAGTVTAARQCHLLAGDTVFHWKVAYNEELSAFSPGVQLELDVLEAFHADPATRWLDPCTDDVPNTSARLYPDRRLIGHVLVGLTPRGRVVTRAHRLLARAKAWAGSLRRRRSAGD